MFDKISTALATIVASVTDLQVVYNFEPSNIEGYPAATITASGDDSEYSTTTENRRIYAFTIRLFVIRPDGVDGERLCELTMRKLVDQITDKLDRNYLLNALEAQAGYTMLWMGSAPSVWGYTGSRENQMRVAEIKVQVHFDVDINSIGL